MNRNWGLTCWCAEHGFISDIENSTHSVFREVDGEVIKGCILCNKTAFSIDELKTEMPEL